MRERFRRKLFQFHKGPIKAWALSLSTLVCLRFNSIKVRLKRSVNVESTSLKRCFNSIKVRLKR